MDVIIIEPVESLKKLRMESVLSKPGYREAKIHLVDSKEKAASLLATMDTKTDVRILEHSILKTREQFRQVIPPRPPSSEAKRPRLRLR